MVGLPLQAAAQANERMAKLETEGQGFECPLGSCPAVTDYRDATFPVFSAAISIRIVWLRQNLETGLIARSVHFFSVLIGPGEVTPIAIPRAFTSMKTAGLTIVSGPI